MATLFKAICINNYLAPSLEFDTVDDFLALFDGWKETHLVDDYYFELGDTWDEALYDFDCFIPLSDHDLAVWLLWFESYSALSNDARYAFEYLREYKYLDVQTALQKSDSVNIFHGGLEAYAVELLDAGHFGEISETLYHYIDLERLYTDLARYGEIAEFQANDNSDLVITNAADF